VESMARLGARYHEVHYAADPIAATVDGVAGYDAEMPDPSRAADERGPAFDLNRRVPWTTSKVRGSPT